MRSEFLVKSPREFALSKVDPADTKGLSEERCCEVLEKNRERIAELQNALYAERERSLLIVLMAIDTGGKDPIIRDVLKLANPQACRVTAFKKENEREARRGRFWRFHDAAPEKGEIGVFNRSYYDDVIRADAHGEYDDAARRVKLRHISNFERVLADEGVRVMKLFLHISKDEQRVRLQERIDNPRRHWELSESDFKERKYWDGYMRAFEAAIRETHTQFAPWHVIPSDRKWFRDAAASGIVCDVLAEMDPQYPAPEVDLSRIEWH